jgi:hypothetical protein
LAFLPGEFGLSTRGERFFALFTFLSSSDFGTARTRVMTRLKCWNSGVLSNPSMFGGLSVCPDSGACIVVGPSAMRDTLLHFPSQLFVGDAAVYDVAHGIRKALCIGHAAIVVAVDLLVYVTEQMERLYAYVGAF